MDGAGRRQRRHVCRPLPVRARAELRRGLRLRQGRRRTTRISAVARQPAPEPRDPQLLVASLLLHELFPERDQAFRLPWRDDPAAAGSGWPVPAPSPVSEDDLAYPEEDARAITHLFARLREYLDSRTASGGGPVGIEPAEARWRRHRARSSKRPGRRTCRGYGPDVGPRPVGQHLTGDAAQAVSPVIQ